MRVKSKISLACGNSVVLDHPLAMTRQPTHPHRTVTSELIGWTGSIVLTGATAAAGALASINAQDFYAGLNQPVWAPPGWLFGPVWSALYCMMAVAAALVWRRRGFLGHRLALSFYLGQLILNGLWSWLFFAWQMAALAFVDVALLWITILCTLLLFWRISKVSGALLIPYLIWVSFAAVLNFSVWQLNPQVF